MHDRNHAFGHIIAVWVPLWIMYFFVAQEEPTMLLHNINSTEVSKMKPLNVILLNYCHHFRHS
jgi:hypothetical protein